MCITLYGFIANITFDFLQFFAAKNNSTDSLLLLSATRLAAKTRAVLHKAQMRFKFTAIHLSAVIFACIIIFISAMLGKSFAL